MSFVTRRVVGDCVGYERFVELPAVSGTTLLGMAANRVLSIVANLPLGIPAAIAFRKYHLDHHRYQGHDGLDVDLPTEWEGRFFRTPLRKLAWVIMQPLFYALRPLVVHPKPLVEWEAVNISTQIVFDALLWWACGPKAVAFLVLSTLLGMGLHPTAYHFISEHFALSPGGFETFSYYGPLNVLQYHVGFHNEHHDFPNSELFAMGGDAAKLQRAPLSSICAVPGSRLHLVKQMAPEFYDDLPHHTSWWGVFEAFIFRDDITPFSRVKREKRIGGGSGPISAETR